MKNKIIKFLAIFVGIPLILWAFGAYHRPTVFKEVLSLLTLVAFCLMIGQLFLTRNSRDTLQGVKMSKMVTVHKLIGYVFAGILLIHPVLIVLPRFFEAGVDPWDALITILTTFDSLGVVVGLIAWVSMVGLGVMAFFRNKLGFSYRTWRFIHGIISLLFISAASWHVINLGRHINTPLTVFIVFLTVGGALILLNNYVFSPAKKIPAK